MLSFVGDNIRNERRVKIQRQKKKKVENKTQDSENSDNADQYRGGCGGGREDKHWNPI